MTLGSQTPSQLTCARATRRNHQRITTCNANLPGDEWADRSATDRPVFFWLLVRASVPIPSILSIAIDGRTPRAQGPLFLMSRSQVVVKPGQIARFIGPMIQKSHEW